MQLSRDALHVWTAILDVASQRLCDLQQTLSIDEVARAERFRLEESRSRFVAARGILRSLLALYLETPAPAIRLSYNEFGKPCLEGSHGACQLSFNVSHSRGLALFAFGLVRDVGIDVEAIDPSVQVEEVAKNFFSRNEITRLMRLPQSARTTGFFNCWTRKEAYIKARGMGLSIPLDSFDVSLNLGDRADLIRAADASDIPVWKVEALEVASDNAAAIAAAGSDWKIVHRGWVR